MKQLKFILMAALAFALIGCSNSANNNDNNSSTGTNFVQGWYKYVTSVQGTTQNYYLCYDANKTLTRAGSESVEFTGVVFDNYKDNDGFSYDTLSNASNESSFRKISDSELPSWATQSNNSNNEETHLSELCSFLQNFSSGINNQNDTVTITNINSTIRRDSDNEPYVSCNISATCNNQNAKYLFNTTNTSISLINVRMFIDTVYSNGNVTFILDETNTKTKSELQNSYPYIYLEYNTTTDLVLGKQQTANTGTGYNYTKN